MARGLAFLQFIIVCLGVFTLHLLGKLNHPGELAGFIPDLARFLGRYALWLIIIPVLWAILGNTLTVRLGERVTNMVGLVLTALIFIIFAVPLFWYLH